MPLYEYACEKCGKVFEVMQKFTDQPLETHDECGGKVDRLLSAPALHFKGSGFYITDYSKGSSSGSSSAKSGDSKNSEGGKSDSSSSSGDSKPAPSASNTSSSSDSKN